MMIKIKIYYHSVMKNDQIIVDITQFLDTYMSSF